MSPYAEHDASKENALEAPIALSKTLTGSLMIKHASGPLCSKLQLKNVQVNLHYKIRDGRQKYLAAF